MTEQASRTESPVGDDEPVMIAWKAYQATVDYENTFNWALGQSVPRWPHESEHVKGSLWAAFVRGFRAGAEAR